MAKVTINISAGLFEAEGTEDFVGAQVLQFQNSMLPAVQEITNRISIDRRLAEGGNKEILANIANLEDIQTPSVRDIVARMVVKNEAMWVLIYGYYLTKSGKNNFTKDDIVLSYEESGRKNRSRMSNLNNSIKIASKKKWISILGESDYFVTPEGIKVAEKIVHEEKESSATNNTNTKKLDKAAPSKKTHESYEIVGSLDLHPEGKLSLADYFKEKIPESNGTASEYILVFVQYLKTTIGIPNVTLDHIFTCFKEIEGIEIPTALKQCVINTENRKGWIDSKDLKSLLVTIGGGNYLRLKLPRPKIK